MSVTHIRQNDAVFVDLRGEIRSAGFLSQERQESSLPAREESVPHDDGDGEEDDEHHGDQVDEPVVEVGVGGAPGVGMWLVERNFGQGVVGLIEIIGVRTGDQSTVGRLETAAFSWGGLLL